MGNIVPDNSDGRNKLKDEIEKLENAGVTVKTTDVPSAKREKLEYTPPTDSEILAAAENSLALEKASGTAKLKEDSAARGKSLDATREKTSDDMAKLLSALGETYEQAAKNIDDDVIKRGLARSSVAVNRKSELEGDYAARASDIKSEYGKKIAEIDTEINGLGEKLKKALDDFNLSYAVKLNQKISELKEEREKKKTEALKYNNQVEMDYAESERNRLQADQKIKSDALDNYAKEKDADTLSKEERDALNKSVYDKMDKFLASMSKEDAKLEINNHSLYKQHLSSYYYTKLYDKYGR